MDFSLAAEQTLLRNSVASVASVICSMREDKDLRSGGMATEQALIEKLREAQQRQWREENRESIAAYNQHVEKHGAVSYGSRSF